MWVRPPPFAPFTALQPGASLAVENWNARERIASNLTVVTTKKVTTIMTLLRRSLLFGLIGLPALADSSVPGIKNFYQVYERVFRGAQPTSEGFQYLAKHGVKTVID